MRRPHTPTDFTRAATLAPSTFDEKTNTVEAVLSTGADVQRAGYIERLPIGNADLRGIVGTPVLDAHNRGSTRAVLGVIQKAWRVDGEIRALIKLSSRDDAAGTVRDIADGILRNVSVGYAVSKWRDETNSKGERIRTALAWTIHEASFVPIGADAGAVVRSTQVKKQKAGADPAFTQEEIDAAYEYVRDLPDDVRELPPEIFDAIAFAQSERRTATPAEILTEIRDVSTRSGLPVDWADSQVKSFTTVEDVRGAAVEALKRRTANAPRVRVLTHGPSPEQTREARSEGLAVRIAGGKPSDQAREFVGFRLVDHARDMLEAQGVRTRGMGAEAILTRAAQHTTSDFADLLTGTGARLLRPAYEAALSPLVALCRKLTANDFRAQSLLQLGEMPNLQEVPESGEIKSITRGEAKESWRLKTYGSIFSLSRQALINDDLNAFADFSTAAGQAAANTVADLIVAVLTESGGQGPVMGDGVRLFHDDHGNISSGAAIDVASVSEARLATTTQRGLDGQIIRVVPDTLVVAPSNQTVAEQLVASITPATVSEANPFASKLNVAVEARLEFVDALAWYLADSRLPALILGGLAGNEGPQIASRDGFDVLGREFRVTLDVGVGPHDFRGWFRNDGATG